MCCRSPKIIYKETAQKHASLISIDIGFAKNNRDLMKICKFSLENKIKKLKKTNFYAQYIVICFIRRSVLKIGKNFNVLKLSIAPISHC